MYIGLASFVTMCALYFSDLSKLRNIDKAAAGLKPPYASIDEDVVAVLKASS
jgi:hypothetical protein